MLGGPRLGLLSTPGAASRVLGFAPCFHQPESLPSQEGSRGPLPKGTALSASLWRHGGSGERPDGAGRQGREQGLRRARRGHAHGACTHPGVRAGAGTRTRPAPRGAAPSPSPEGGPGFNRSPRATCSDRARRRLRPVTGGAEPPPDTAASTPLASVPRLLPTADGAGRGCGTSPGRGSTSVPSAPGHGSPMV